MSTDAGIDDFPAFFLAVYGHAPFKWQVRLADEVYRTGRWPDLLDLPTGAGKTATMDVAVFVRALRDDQPRRVVFVVDRRVIVHQAYRRAGVLSRALADPQHPVVAAVADRLRACAFDRCLTTPMVTAELRGGIPLDEAWAMRPDTPAVLVSTVDQVGSRLLFRGYGVSRGMRPVHAGLLGNDTLFLLDEVHLARPFAETLRAIGDHYRELGGLPDRWQVVELSATPAKPSTSRFHLVAADREDELLARRLAARKPVTMEAVKVRGSEPEVHRGAMVDKCEEHAKSFAGLAHVRRVGVVVNRVQTAVDIHARLGNDACLLTGRMRPLDRAAMQDELDSHWLLGRDRSAASRFPARFLVATQTVEAGADLDLDALVTECAPFDSLVQRFGRVDRDGILSAEGTPAPGVILATTAQVKERDDPVYGSALGETWAWLQTLGDLDFGPDARPHPPGDVAGRLRVASPPPPVLLPTHLDAWSQTSSPPHADPDPDLWLHGLRDSADLDVSVIWRADLAELNADHTEALTDWVAACPPGAGEAMSVPIGAVRRWLEGQLGAGATAAGEVADIEGSAATISPSRARGRDRPAGRPALRWRADEGSSVVHGAELRPGDTIVVPASYGGVSPGKSWDPRSTSVVPDLATQAQRSRRGWLVLRLVPGLVGSPPVPPVDAVAPLEVVAFDLATVRQWLVSAAVHTWVTERAQHPADDAVVEAIVALREHDPDLEGIRIHRLDRGSGPAFILDGPWPGPTVAGDFDDLADSVDSEPGTSSFIGRTVTLKQHLDDVGEWAGGMAAKCGLSPALAGDLGLAGRLHDLGKADPRFQQILADGGVPGELLAKSVGRRTSRSARREAQRRAGYPDHARHELLSTSLLAQAQDLEEAATDWDLVLHLVASHHGHARPTVPVTLDQRPVPVAVPADLVGTGLCGPSDHHLHRLDAGVTERFWLLTARYGWYGLAWLEAILRLADHRASAERQAGGARHG